MGAGNLEVTLKRAEPDRETRVCLADTMLGAGAEGFRRLDGALAAFRNDPDFSGIELDAWAWVPHQDVVRALDSVRAAGFEDVTFVGAPWPSEKAR